MLRNICIAGPLQKGVAALFDVEPDPIKTFDCTLMHDPGYG